MNEIFVTSLVDNCVTHPKHSSKGLLGEHGLSFLINIGKRQILFDTGRGNTISQNANLLGLELSGVEAVVLSHAHGDHTGGLETVLKNTGQVNVYVQPDIFKPKYTIELGKDPVYNVMSKTREEYEALGARFIIRDRVMEIANGIFLLGPIAREKPSDDMRMSNRFVREGTEYKPDPFTDEQVLAINTPQGLVLILGCTHNGLENTIEQANKMTGKRIAGIVGGLHLCDAEPQKVKKLGLWLQKTGVDFIVCSHCTGLESAAILYSSLGKIVSFNYVGKKIVLYQA